LEENADTKNKTGVRRDGGSPPQMAERILFSSQSLANRHIP